MSITKNFQVKNGLSINGQQVIDGNANASLNIVTANTLIVSGSNLISTISIAYNQANAANNLAQSGYNQANAANNLAQSSYNQANAANNLAQSSYNQANSANNLAQNSYNQANSANNLAQSSYNQANAANNLAQSAYNKANTGGGGASTCWSTICNINNNLGPTNIAIGQCSGFTSQSITSIAIGENAGQISQGNGGDCAIAIGVNAGCLDQGSQSVSIGVGAGCIAQLNDSVAIGSCAGGRQQHSAAIAIGCYTGYCCQGSQSVAVGCQAGYNTQCNDSIAIGSNAGQYYQQSGSLAIGCNAGQNNQNGCSIAIGVNAGCGNQGCYSIAIGYSAGCSCQCPCSVVLNASPYGFPIMCCGFYVNPIRCKITCCSVLYYNCSTNEITWGAAPSGGGGGGSFVCNSFIELQDNFGNCVWGYSTSPTMICCSPMVSNLSFCSTGGFTPSGYLCGQCVICMCVWDSTSYVTCSFPPVAMASFTMCGNGFGFFACSYNGFFYSSGCNDFYFGNTFSGNACWGTLPISF